jgi:hypothetical protein
MSEVAVQDKVGVDPKALDERELMALVRATQEEIEAHGEWNEFESLVKRLCERASGAVCARKSTVGAFDGVASARVEDTHLVKKLVRISLKENPEPVGAPSDV